ncbi:unnamed protein product [Orchesella dallaii]|uniref:diacylglycerol O-acyltransferase n=1 Tax=Orchesella dallaii TaxID=48710 RepID=A0ABP1S5C6_9HEXA
MAISWRTLIGTLIWLAIIPIVTIPFGVLALYKVCLSWAAKLFKIRGENGVDKLYPLDPVDCMMVADSSSKRPIVNFGFLLIIEGRIGLSELRAHFQTCFLNENEENRYEKFYSHLESIGGHVFRATASTLDINEHVVERRMERGKKLEKFLVDWIHEEWKQLKPCWEMILVPLNRNGGANEQTGIAFKIHHAFADGYSLLHILDRLTGCKSPYLVKDFKEGMLTQMTQLLEGPLHLGKFGGGEPSRNPFRVRLDSVPEGMRRKHEYLLSFTSVNLEDVKRIRRKYNVKMFSVLFTIISGALRRYLLEVEKKEVVPEEYIVGMTLPWPRHPSVQAGTANKDKMCNHWVVALLKVPLREPNPELRLKAIDAELHQWQEGLGLDKFIGRIMQPLMWTMPRFFVEKATADDVGAGGGLTSLVGAEEGYTFLGNEVTNVHPFIAVPDNNPWLALSCFSFSHKGRMELTFGAHPSVFGDQGKLNYLCQKLFHDEFYGFLQMK